MTTHDGAWRTGRRTDEMSTTTRKAIAAGRIGTRPGDSGGRRMLERADGYLSRAGGAPGLGDQYRELYHAALRGAAALLAEKETGVRRPTRNAWLRIAKADSGYGEWVSYFTAVSGVVAALETAGRTVDADEVALLHDRVQAFLNRVEQDLIADS
jgi:hypothetical protein